MIRTVLSVGLTRRQRLSALGTPMLMAWVTGIVGAALGWAASAMGPVASARAVEPNAGRSLSGDATLSVLGVALLVLVLVAGASVVATMSSRAVSPAPPPP